MYLTNLFILKLNLYAAYLTEKWLSGLQFIHLFHAFIYWKKNITLAVYT